MRSKKILINSLFGLFGYLLLMVSNFITRSVFIDQLGMSMAGVDTTFKNFLHVLSLAELGLSTGLTYKLYKPIQEQDNYAIKKILNFYKKAYSVIAAVFMGGALVLSVVVNFFVSDSGLHPVYISVLFILYAADTVASYLFANRKALIVADQNNYIVNRNDALISLLALVFQVTLLYLTRSFIVFALVKIVCRLLGASLIGRKFTKLYPHIAADRSKDLISGEERKALMQNMSAMLCHRIGGVSVTATGSAIISKILGTVMAGIYGNYTLITTTLLQLLTQIFHGITASYGNVLHSEEEGFVYKKFKQIYFFNYLLISFATVSVAVLIQPFMRFWISEQGSILPYRTVALFLVYFYLFGMRRVILMSKDSAGLYRPDRYCAILEAVLNIFLSIVLALKLHSIDGIILANIISVFLIPFWTQPILVYKRVLFRNPLHYYLRYGVYTLITAAMTVLTLWLSSYITVGPILLELFVKAIVCLAVPNLINLVLFWRTEEMRSLIAMFKRLVKRN